MPNNWSQGLFLTDDDKQMLKQALTPNRFLENLAPLLEVAENSNGHTCVLDFEFLFAKSY